MTHYTIKPQKTQSVMTHYIPNQHKSSFTNRKRFFMEYCKTIKPWLSENAEQLFEEKINNPAELLYAQEHTKAVINNYKITGSLN